MIKKLLKEFSGKLDSVIGNKLDEFDLDNTVQTDVFEEVDPRDIKQLQARYERGEISFEEFRRKLDNLAYTAQSEYEGEMGIYYSDDGYDTPAGHRAWDQEKNEWDIEDEWEKRDWDDLHDDRYYENIDDDMSNDFEDEEVQDFIADTAYLLGKLGVPPNQVYGKTKLYNPDTRQTRLGFVDHLMTHLYHVDDDPAYDLMDTLEKILSSGKYTESELAQKVARAMSYETNPLDAKGEIEAQPSLYDSVEENEDFDDDKDDDDESAEDRKDSVFVQLKKITDSFEEPNLKKPNIKKPLRHVVTDDGITVEVSYDDAVAIVDLMQADVKPESKQKMQEFMKTAEGLQSLIDYLSS